MNDRELLGLAAKAAGLLLEYPDDEDGVFIAREKYRNGHVWNPLTDDGDALRLAVKLSLRVECYTCVKIHPKYGECNITDVYSIDESVALSESHNGDPCAATRRAIVRAAAAIGAAMNSEGE